MGNSKGNTNGQLGKNLWKGVIYKCGLCIVQPRGKENETTFGQKEKGPMVEMKCIGKCNPAIK